MSILAVEIEIPYAVDVHATADTLTVDLSDGRAISVPLGWYPRLEHASPDERSNWRLIGKGQGIHWENIDEDIGVGVFLLESHQEKVRLLSKNGFRADNLPQPWRAVDRLLIAVTQL